MGLTDCRECHAPISTKARSCPACGAHRGHGCLWFLVWIVVAVLGASLAVILPEVLSVTSMHLGEWNYEGGRAGQSVIRGEAMNASGRELQSVTVQFTLYDESGAQVGVAMATTMGLEADAVWKFEAIGFAPSARTARFKRFTTF